MPPALSSLRWSSGAIKDRVPLTIHKAIFGCSRGELTADQRAGIRRSAGKPQNLSYGLAFCWQLTEVHFLGPLPECVGVVRGAKGGAM